MVKMFDPREVSRTGAGHELTDKQTSPSSMSTLLPKLETLLVPVGNGLVQPYKVMDTNKEQTIKVLLRILHITVHLMALKATHKSVSTTK